jgi:hypothetical protein
VTTATTAESPSMIAGWARMLEIAPSRISPTPSGRSGMTPGLGGGGGGAHCPQAGPGCGPAPGG